ncbi:MAG TPA: oligosaccharide flippase family protein [Ferruginibacter sp.]|nr:oligosaccharide flippase family protein [Ferruginibacter sp.]HMP21274.1 oligosaccharide flippase family protein [Ferruginibacter sp.]
MAGQTVWYGLSSLLSRFLNYLLTPYLTAVLLQADYGEMSTVYAAIPFVSVVFMFGLETAYFRFATHNGAEEKVYSTASIFLIALTGILFLMLLLFKQPLARLINVQEHPEYIVMSACIVALDALSSLAFARLRFHSKPKKFAFVRITSILLNIFFTIFFLSICPWLAQHKPDSFLLFFYHSDIGIGYIFIANILQSAVCLLLLRREFLGFTWAFDKKLWKKIAWYCMPLVIVGICNAVNETADRLMLGWWQSGNAIAIKEDVGAYSACSKLASLVTVAIFAFRLGAEPFFFRESEKVNHQLIYARVMNFFIIAVCGMFLLVSLHLVVLKYFIQNPAMWAALKVVPVLLFANIFLGIHYNLSIWYKLKNKTIAGAVISIAGSIITIGLNYAFIPVYGYMACAWASLACYAGMVAISYAWGRAAYPVPYNLVKIAGYLLLTLLLYGIHWSAGRLFSSDSAVLIAGIVLFLIFWLIVYRVERHEFIKIKLWQQASKLFR